jgi:hypothetical protein
MTIALTVIGIVVFLFLFAVLMGRWISVAAHCSDALSDEDIERLLQERPGHVEVVDKEEEE